MAVTYSPGTLIVPRPWAELRNCLQNLEMPSWALVARLIQQLWGISAIYIALPAGNVYGGGPQSYSVVQLEEPFPYLFNHAVVLVCNYPLKEVKFEHLRQERPLTPSDICRYFENRHGVRLMQNSSPENLQSSFWFT